MIIFKSINKLVKEVNFKADVGFVPTMGSLHKGHISLIKKSQKKCQKTIVSIFVNPSQFNKINDYKKTLKTCHSTVGVAILNTSITIVFGFSILVLSKFIPTIYFGIFTGLAMLFAMISVLTLLPSLILVFKPFGK